MGAFRRLGISQIRHRNTQFRTPPSPPRPEQRAAHAHMRRAQHDGGLEVLAHAHAEARQAVVVSLLGRQSERARAFRGSQALALVTATSRRLALRSFMLVEKDNARREVTRLSGLFRRQTRTAHRLRKVLLAGLVDRYGVAGGLAPEDPFRHRPPRRFGAEAPFAHIGEFRIFGIAGAFGSPCEIEIAGGGHGASFGYAPDCSAHHRRDNTLQVVAG